MSIDTQDHLLTFATLLEVWGRAMAAAMRLGVDEERAAEIVGAWLDERLHQERAARRASASGEHTTVGA